MHPFREVTPERKTVRPICKHWSAHRATLKKDFNRRCGYCDDSDKLRIKSFTIDHFIPRNPKTFVNKIHKGDYNNLVYACHFCNSGKSNKWPTNDPKQANDGIKGFIEPTTEEYTNLFKRNKIGEIDCSGTNPNIANYLIQELKLDHEVHSVTWRLEKLNKLEKEISKKILKIKDIGIKKALSRTHNQIYKEITLITRNLFSING